MASRSELEEYSCYTFEELVDQALESLRRIEALLDEVDERQQLIDKLNTILYGEK